MVAAIDESKGYTDTQLADYSTTAEMNQAISNALVPFETAVQRDAAIAAALASYYTSARRTLPSQRSWCPTAPRSR